VSWEQALAAVLSLAIVALTRLVDRYLPQPPGVAEPSAPPAPRADQIEIVPDQPSEPPP
jgi:hypothetical protein